MNRFEVIPFIEKGGGEGVPDNMGVDSFPNQSLFRQRFDEAIDRPSGQGLLFVGAMLTKGVENRVKF